VGGRRSQAGTLAATAEREQVGARPDHAVIIIILIFILILASAIDEDEEPLNSPARLSIRPDTAE
jgi:hypothetical protein